jgi:beta-1,4-mannosyl-glycoprotein beta-1,4-N-acetylglucosaminyltransferase
MKIIDYFPYFDPYGKELLELRIRVLENYVDEFIICESNKTQSGIPIEYTLSDRIDQLGLPKDKIRILQLDIPNDDLLDIQEIDYLNCYEDNKHNINSLRSRVRERLQKDALLQVIDEYDNDTIIIHSDSDEIINPSSLSWILNLLNSSPEIALKIPLAYIEGRADLRVYNENTGLPVPWYGMFMCFKQTLKKATPSQIRGQVLCPIPIHFPIQDGNIIQDLGWHFSWMGGKEAWLIKSQSFTHYDDTFSYLKYNDYKSELNQNHLKNLKLEENLPPPSNLKNAVLKNYSIENLPKEIFSNERIKNFFLPS